MQIFVVALAPILIALTGLAVALPVGIHYANKERANRMARSVHIFVGSSWIAEPLTTVVSGGIWTALQTPQQPSKRPERQPVALPEAA